MVLKSNFSGSGFGWKSAGWAIGVVLLNALPAQAEWSSTKEQAKLTYRAVSGLGAPRPFKEECAIEGSLVTVVDGKNRRKRSTAYTVDVANEAKVVSLLKLAASGTYRSALRPRGAAMIAYEGVVSSPNARFKAVVLKGVVSGQFALNTAVAAKKLLQFIDFNCQDQ